MIFMAFSKLIFHLFLLLMAQGRTKDGLCITRVYSPHPSNSPPRCLRDESQFILLREGELFVQRAAHYHQHFASTLVWMTLTVLENRKCQAFLRMPWRTAGQNFVFT
jgi:hypothetical protein